MGSIASVPRQAGDARILACLNRDGAVIIEEFLTADIVALLNAEIDTIVALEAGIERQFVNESIASFFGDRVTHICGLAGKSPLFVDHVLCHPRYMAACDGILGPNCADYQLNIAHLMERLPGSLAQLVHRDAWVWKRLPKETGEIQLASVIALQDFTADNGATVVAPGSHRWGDDRYPEPGEMVAAEMKAGSAVVYLGQTFHGGGANISAGNRRGLHVSYCAGWLRTEENNTLSTPIEIARQMPTRAQELLGFGVHDDLEQGGGYLGTVELTAPHLAWK